MLTHSNCSKWPDCSKVCEIDVWDHALFALPITYQIFTLKQYINNTYSMATFTQQQNTVVNPVFESLIWLRSHAVRLFTGVTTAFCNRAHTCKFSGLNNRILGTHVLCERIRTGQLVVRHVIQHERETLCRTNERLPCGVCFHVWFR